MMNPFENIPESKQFPDTPDIKFAEASPKTIKEISSAVKETLPIIDDSEALAVEVERQLSPTQRMAYAYENLKEQRESQKLPEFPKVGFLGDGGSIEGQQINIIEQPNELHLSFRLNTTKHKQALEKIAAIGRPDTIDFALVSNPKKGFSLKKAYAVTYEGITIQIAAEVDKFRRFVSKILSDPGWGYSTTNAFDRCVVIKISKNSLGDPPDFSRVAEKIEQLMSDILDVENGLKFPEEKDELEFKKTALAEQLKKLPEEIANQEAEKLERQEVFPGIFSYVERGRSENLMRSSPYAIHHRIQLGETDKSVRELICRMLTGHGLISTSERLERGIMRDGHSSFVDVETGGARYAFTRLAIKEGLKGKDQKLRGYYLVFDPALLNRTDWFAYYYDKFGSTDPRFYDKRPDINQFIETIRKRHRDLNEVMFRGGIPAKQIIAVVCSKEKERANLIADLKASGFKEINGKPIEEFVKVGNLGTMIDTATKERHRLPSRKLKKIGRAKGSNEGGFYVDPATGEKLYVKVYKDPDQAKSEYLANAIYSRLNINVPQSELFEMDGQLVLGSTLIPGIQPMSLTEMQLDKNLREGFVADAFLGNWDVVGDGYDNIHKDNSGRTWRMDAGGALQFRAMGKNKKLDPSDIPELKSMRNPKYPAGKVFGSLSEKEMAEQAQKIIECLTDDAIDDLIHSARLSRYQEDKLRILFIGRRQALIQRFNLNTSEVI